MSWWVLNLSDDAVPVYNLILLPHQRYCDIETGMLVEKVDGAYYHSCVEMYLW